MSLPAFPTWVSGALFQPGQPSFAAEDEGLLLGLSVFDSMIWDRGCVFFFEEHMQRFQSGLEQLGVSWPLPWEPEVAMNELIHAIQATGAMPEQLILRMTATRGVPGRGPSLSVAGRLCEELPAGGVVVALAGELKAIGDRCEGIKSTNRLRNVLAREAGRAKGAWEVIFATTDGDLSEGTISNLFAVIPGAAGARLVTPSEERGCLGGIIRNLVIADLQREPLLVDGQVIPIEVGRVLLSDLGIATELFLTNTTQRVIPVREILEHHANLAGVTGPVTRAVAERIALLEATYRAKG